MMLDFGAKTRTVLVSLGKLVMELLVKRHNGREISLSLS